jgi:acetoin utilization deacetylase AcuC-like enzyme
MNDMVSRRTFCSALLNSAVASHLYAKKRAAPDRCSPPTGYCYDTHFLDHYIEKHHPETPQRLRAIQKKLRHSDLFDSLTPVQPIEKPLPAIQLIHSERHIDSIRSLPITGSVATRAAAGVCGAVRDVCTGKVCNAFCAVRPPGHHATNTGKEEGFCYFNNVAVAARYAQQQYNCKHVLIIDWDYHHGNGTQWAFYDDPTVLFFSTHNTRSYPGTGRPSETGSGKGKGFTINVDLRCGTTDKTMIDVWKRSLLPRVDSFAPDIVLISAGFDSRRDDPLGCFAITDYGFMKMTEMAMGIADRFCNKRLVSVLEGGYNIQGQADAVYAHVNTMITTGKESGR